MQVILPEILEILRVFGIEVSSGSFDFTTDSKDEDRIIPHCLSSNIKNFANVTRAVVAHGTVCHASEDMKEGLEGAVVRVDINVKKNQQCDQCLKKFSNKDSLSSHIRYVHGQPVQCGQCQKKFSCKKGLSVHIETVHNKNKLQCDQCLKKFSQKGYLDQHIKTMHMKEKAYPCKHCLRKFSWRSNLSVHMKICKIKTISM